MLDDLLGVAQTDMEVRSILRVAVRAGLLDTNEAKALANVHGIEL